AATLAVDVSNAKLRSPRPGGRSEHLPASGSLSLSLAEGQLRLSELNGTIAGATVGGRLLFDMKEQPITFEGDLEVSALDLSAAVGTAAGVPAPVEVSGSAVGAWRAEPFERSPHAARGRIAVKVARVSLTPNLSGSEFKGMLHVGEQQLAVQLIDGKLA